MDTNQYWQLSIFGIPNLQFETLTLQKESSFITIPLKRSERLLPEMVCCYRKKMIEICEKPDMDEVVHQTVATNVVVELCRYRLENNEGYSQEEIENFINQKLMPELKP